MENEFAVHQPSVPASDLDAEEKQKRSGSFGAVATDYERFRPGPPPDALDWLLPKHVNRVIDLGAGTGALTRLLVGRADEVVAVEPDDRMRSVLTEMVPGIKAVKGKGESMPIPDGTADAVLASSSWHWMDTVPTLAEVSRVLVPGGVLGAMWSGPDPEGPFLVQARTLIEQSRQGDLADGQSEPAAAGIADVILGEANRPNTTLDIPAGARFGPPECRVFNWDIGLNADELIGLLGTFSWIITMSDQAREQVFTEARRLLSELLGVVGDATVDVLFRAEVWRSFLV